MQKRTPKIDLIRKKFKDLEKKPRGKVSIEKLLAKSYIKIDKETRIKLFDSTSFMSSGGKIWLCPNCQIAYPISFTKNNGERLRSYNCDNCGSECKNITYIGSLRGRLRLS